MKYLAILLALGGSLWTLAFADELGGISGTFVDAKSGSRSRMRGCTTIAAPIGKAARTTSCS